MSIRPSEQQRLAPSEQQQLVERVAPTPPNSPVVQAAHFWHEIPENHAPAPLLGRVAPQAVPPAAWVAVNLGDFALPEQAVPQAVLPSVQQHILEGHVEYHYPQLPRNPVFNHEIAAIAAPAGLREEVLPDVAPPVAPAVIPPAGIAAVVSRWEALVRQIAGTPNRTIG